MEGLKWMDFSGKMKDQLTLNWQNWNSLRWKRYEKKSCKIDWKNGSEGEDGGKSEWNKEWGVTIHYHPFVYNN
jgi:hypothetical protein